LRRDDGPWDIKEALWWKLKSSALGSKEYPLKLEVTPPPLSIIWGCPLL